MQLDHNDSAVLERRMKLAAAKLQALSERVGMAKTVKAYDGDRRKRILSEAVFLALKAGAKSITEAEHVARASDEYGQKLDAQQAQLEAADNVLAQYDAEELAWKTSQSLLAMARENMKQL